MKGPSGLLAVYYLACNNDLKMKIDPQIEARGHEDGDPGVVNGKCSIKLLEYAKRYVGPAHWLYIARLPPPHDNNEWSSWYLSRLIKKQGQFL